MELHFTHIIEPVRRRFGLSRDEYALCNYVHVWASYAKSVRPGWCDRTMAQIADFVGVSERGAEKMLKRMESLGLIEILALQNKSYKRASVTWFDAVNLAPEGEQSSLSTPNKVRSKGEQSSLSTPNKVRSHNKEVINSNYSLSNGDGDLFSKNFSENKKEVPGGAAPKTLTVIEAIARIDALVAERPKLPLDLCDLAMFPDGEAKWRQEAVAFFSHYLSENGYNHPSHVNPERFFEQRFIKWLKDAKYRFSNSPATRKRPTDSRSVEQYADAYEQWKRK